MLRLSPAAMASRLFLTLLALLTGLAAQIAPAQARSCAEQTSAVTIQVAEVTRSPAALVKLARLPEAGRRHARLVADEGGQADGALCEVASVYIGIDRARE